MKEEREYLRSNMTKIFKEHEEIENEDTKLFE